MGNILVEKQGAMLYVIDILSARLVQAARTLPSHGRGPWFKSRSAHQFCFSLFPGDPDGQQLRSSLPGWNFEANGMDKIDTFTDNGPQRF